MKPLDPCAHCGGRVLVEPAFETDGIGAAYEAKCLACGRSPLGTRPAISIEEELGAGRQRRGQDRAEYKAPRRSLVSA